MLYVNPLLACHQSLISKLWTFPQRTDQDCLCLGVWYVWLSSYAELYFLVSCLISAPSNAISMIIIMTIIIIIIEFRGNRVRMI